MPLLVTPLDVAHATIPTIADGERVKAANLTPTAQQLADLAEVARQSILHLATPNSVVPGGRGITDGIKRIRQGFTNFAALSALVVNASNDREIAMVCAADGSNLAFVYDHGSAAALFSPFVIDAAGSTGRWFCFGYNALIGVTPGLPYVDAAGKLIGPTKVKGAIKEYTDLATTPTAVALTAQGSVTDSAVFVDGLAGSIFSVPNVEIGDILEINYSILAILVTANITAKGNILLRCGPSPAGPFTDLQNIIIGNNGTNNAADLITEVSLAGRYIASAAGTHIVKAVISTNTGGGTRTLNIFSPINGLVKRIEP